MNIYEITEEYKVIQDAIENEEITEEEYEDRLSCMDMELEHKVDGYCCVIENTNASIKAISDTITKLTARKKALENRQDRLKRNLLNSLRLIGKDKVQGQMFSVRVSVSKSVRITDLQKLMSNRNSQYVRTKISKDPDKIAIREALNEGKKLSFAVLEPKESLKIIIG